MATVIRKSKLGVEDIHLDDLGAGATAQTLKSDGNYRTVRKVNASHIPTTATVRTKSSTATDVDKALVELFVMAMSRLVEAGGTMSGTIDMNANKIIGLANGTTTGDALHVGQVDGSTLEVSGGVLMVKAVGVTAAKLATNAVETDKIKALNVTPAKLSYNPGFYTFAAGYAALNDSTTPAAITVSGLLSTDIITVTIRTAPTNSVFIRSCTCINDSFTVVWSGAPGSTAAINYAVSRATA
jgi:hypothetical protein